MNYAKIYDALCARGRNRIEQGVKKTGHEDHHIVPRCLGGSDDKENIARLTTREHFVAHWLLVKMYPSIRGLRLAFFRMAHTQAKGMLNSRAYSRLRMWYAELKRQELLTRNADPIFRAKKVIRSKKVMAEHSKKITALAKLKNKELRKDPVFVARCKKNHEAVVAKPVLCVETGRIFSSLTYAAQSVLASYPKAKGNKIGSCCSGKIKSIYGHTWRYANIVPWL